VSLTVTSGAVYHSTLWRFHSWTPSDPDLTSNQTWVFKAQLLNPSAYKYKYLPFMLALFATDLSPYHLAPSVLNVIISSLCSILPPMVFPKALILVLNFSSCTLPLSVLSSPPISLTTTFMQIMFNSYSSVHPPLTETLLTLNMLFNGYYIGLERYQV